MCKVHPLSLLGNGWFDWSMCCLNDSKASLTGVDHTSDGSTNNHDIVGSVCFYFGHYRHVYSKIVIHPQIKNDISNQLSSFKIIFFTPMFYGLNLRMTSIFHCLNNEILKSFPGLVRKTSVWKMRVIVPATVIVFRVVLSTLDLTSKLWMIYEAKSPPFTCRPN